MSLMLEQNTTGSSVQPFSISDVLLLEAQEDPKKPLTDPDQPRWFRIPIALLPTASTKLHEFLQTKTAGTMDDPEDQSVYNPHCTSGTKLHIPCKVIYMDGFFASAYKCSTFEMINNMNFEVFWKALETLLVWVETKEIKSKKGKTVAKALRVGKFLVSDEEYLKALADFNAA